MAGDVFQSPMIGVVSDLEVARAGSVLRDSRPIAKCHPGRPMASMGLCEPCYTAHLYEVTPPDPPEPVVNVGPIRTVEPQPRTEPTTAEVRALLAVIEHTTMEAAGAVLGLAPDTVRNQLGDLYRRIGARSRAHAAWLLARGLGASYVLPRDRTRRGGSG